MKIDKQDLDRHITGNYGEDQFKNEMDVVNEYDVYLKICGIEGKVIVSVYATSKDEAYNVALETVCSIKHNDCYADAINITRRNINV